MSSSRCRGRGHGHHRHGQRGGARHQPAAWTVRNNVRIEAGRKPESGKAEICVGKKMAGRFNHTGVGETLRFAGRNWNVVCHFSANGSAFESEIWGENEQFMPVFRGDAFQSVTFRLKDPAAFEEAKRTLEADRRLTVDVHREADFYAEQSQLLGRILTILALLITSIMAIGAIFGAINTMYAAVASRSPRDRGAADARLPSRERAGQLSGGIGADRARRRRDRSAAGAADQRHRHQHHELGQLQRDRVQLSGDAGAAAGGALLRGGDGAGRRILPGPAGGEAAGGSGASVGR